MFLVDTISQQPNEAHNTWRPDPKRESPVHQAKWKEVEGNEGEETV